METYATKTADIERRWHVLDASGKPLGRLCSQAAGLLMGKHKPQFSPQLDTGDFVVIINAANILVTGPGRKGAAKTYYRHSTYPGGLKKTSLQEMLKSHPGRAIELGIKGMLPHNNLGRAMFRKLKVYSGSEHPHQPQLSVKTKTTSTETEAAK
jgi:large subunit ribosomal protein L13